MENGIAYGFFHCDTPKKEIEREIPSLKKATKIPDLDLLVKETVDLLRRDKKNLVDFAGVSDEADLRALDYFAEMANDAELNYAVRATCPGKPNNNIAHELSHILMQASQSYLNRLGEVWGNVVYKNSEGKYVFFQR